MRFFYSKIFSTLIYRPIFSLINSAIYSLIYTSIYSVICFSSHSVLANVDNPCNGQSDFDPIQKSYKPATKSAGQFYCWCYGNLYLLNDESNPCYAKTLKREKIKKETCSHCEGRSDEALPQVPHVVIPKENKEIIPKTLKEEEKNLPKDSPEIPEQKFVTNTQEHAGKRLKIRSEIKNNLKLRVLTSRFIPGFNQYTNVTQAIQEMKKVAHFLIDHPELKINITAVVNALSKKEGKYEESVYKIYKHYGQLHAEKCKQTLIKLGVSKDQIKKTLSAEPGTYLLFPPNLSQTEKSNQRIFIQYFDENGKALNHF